MSDRYYNLLFSGIDTGTIGEITSIIDSLQLSWRILIENTGKQCLDKFKNGDFPDVVVLSTKLPDMSGFELTKNIRDDSDIPIIFITSDSDIKSMISAFDSGADDYIVMPFNKAIFIARIHALIRRYNWNYGINDESFKTINIDTNKTKKGSFGLLKQIKI
jgi:two-component system response regulator VanR